MSISDAMESVLANFRFSQDPSVRLVLMDDADTIAVHSAFRTRVIHREDADPEHRLFEYRVAAAWFGNAPAGVVA